MNIIEGIDDKFAIDLLWLRPGRVGGSESFVKNLISGMQMSDGKYEVYLVVSDENQEWISDFLDDSRFIKLLCPVSSENIKQRIIYQNFKLTKLLLSHGIHKCFEPIYSIPLTGTDKIEYYAVIHDLQAIHFPQYFRFTKLQYLKFSWKHTLRHAKKVITVSEYSKNDIISNFKTKGNIIRIYNPVDVAFIPTDRARSIVEKCGLEAEKFFFCVTSLMPHKNVDVLLDIMSLRNDDYKLVVCGVGGILEKEFKQRISDLDLEKRIVLLPYVDDEFRNAFYNQCKLFLFPSIFEGFGMPPIEAMMYGKAVITTKLTSIYEVTQGKAIYVDNPLDAAEWNTKIDEALQTDKTEFDFGGQYDKEAIAERYLDVICG